MLPSSEMSALKGRILAHRGIQISVGPRQLDDLGQIALALQEGFGVEFDIMHHGSGVVIAHDPPPWKDEKPRLEELFKVGEVPSNSFMAINVKSSGLANRVPKFPSKHFFFDHSFPDLLRYVKLGIPSAFRLSEYESLDENLSNNAEYWWVDSFESDWFLIGNKLHEILALKGIKFFVSPEIHGRDPSRLWSQLIPVMRIRPDVGLCTDLPSKFFRELIHGP